jgi:large subunit ribosomal protein L14e
MIAVGSICKKMAGREAGRYCVVLSIEGKFAQISGVRKYGMCRPKRCNLKHLKPTSFKIEIISEKQEDVRKAIYNSGILTKMGLKKDKRERYTKRPLWEQAKSVEKAPVEIEGAKKEGDVKAKPKEKSAEKSPKRAAEAKPKIKEEKKPPKTEDKSGKKVEKAPSEKTKKGPDKEK